MTSRKLWPIRTHDGAWAYGALPAQPSWLAGDRRGGLGGLKPKPPFGRPPKPRARERSLARAKMDLRHGGAEDSGAAQIPVCDVDARDCGGADQAEFQHRAGSHWPPIRRGICWRGSAAPHNALKHNAMPRHKGCLHSRLSASSTFTMSSISAPSMPVHNYLRPRETQGKFSKPFEFVLYELCWFATD